MSRNLVWDCWLSEGSSDGARRISQSIPTGDQQPRSTHLDDDAINAPLGGQKWQHQYQGLLIRMLLRLKPREAFMSNDSQYHARALCILTLQMQMLREKYIAAVTVVTHAPGAFTVASKRTCALSTTRHRVSSDYHGAASYIVRTGKKCRHLMDVDQSVNTSH